VELKVSVSEALALIKEIENVPAKLFDYIGMSIQKEVGSFLSNLMGKELTDHIGREKYERKEGSTDYRNGSYIRTFCIKGTAMSRSESPGIGTAIFSPRCSPGQNATMTGSPKTWQPSISPASAREPSLYSPRDWSDGLSLQRKSVMPPQN
jgi:hypothetical protein